MTGGDVVLLCWMRLLRRAHHIKTHFFFPAGKRNGFWNPKKKGLFRVAALCGVRRRPASLRPHGGPAPAVTAYAGGTGKGGISILRPPLWWVSRRSPMGAPGRRAPHKKRFRIGAAGGRRPPLPKCFSVLVGAAFGRPPQPCATSPSVILSVPSLSF